MLMYRDPIANCDERFDFLYDTLFNELNTVDREFTRNQAAIGLADSPALYRELCLATPDESGVVLAAPSDPGWGCQILLQFLAFGDDREEALRHLDRVFQNIELACRRVSEILKTTNSVQS